MNPRPPSPSTPSFPSLLLLLLTSLLLGPSLSPSSSSSSSLSGVQALEEAPAYLQTVQSWSHMLQRARAQASAPPPPSSAETLLRPWLALTLSGWRDVILAGDDVRGALMTSEGAETWGLCLNHSLAVVEGLAARQGWAVQMLDAMGKPLFGITDGNVNWPGGYNQCLRVRANTTVVSRPDFSGQYCTVSSKPPPPLGVFSNEPAISLGVCVPDSCSAQDVSRILAAAAKALNVTSQINPFTMCEEPRPLDAKAVVAIVICSIFLFLMVVGTALDLLFLQSPRRSSQRIYRGSNNEDDDNDNKDNDDDDKVEGRPRARNAVVDSEHQPLLPKSDAEPGSAGPVKFGPLGKALVAFSVYTNGSKLLSTQQPPGSLTCVHGVRFLSMTWVVLGHAWGSAAGIGMNLLPYLQDLNSHWAYQAITNATVSVDSFFVLSGLLVAYLTLREMKKRGGKLNLLFFYFHRFWRLTPCYMLCMMVAVCLAPYWGRGPFWPAKFADEDFCAKNWWTNLLYINNLVRTKEACFGVSWYLANDMQFYILSPIIFIPFFFSPLFGVLVAGVFLLITAIIPGVLSQHYGLPPGILQQVEGFNNNTMMDFMDVYYFKPYNRMGAYVIGLLAGAFLYRSNCKLRIPWVINLGLWGLATACALAVLYGLFESSNGHPVTVPVAAFYNAVNRQVWGACVAWVVVACVTGNGGFVNTILSWPALVPLSRLTYCIYLLHINVIYLFVYNSRTVFYMDDINLIFLFLPVLVCASAMAFVASLAFEAPMMALEKAFLRPRVDKEEQKP